jgi:hypothetical protein
VVKQLKRGFNCWHREGLEGTQGYVEGKGMESRLFVLLHLSTLIL